MLELFKIKVHYSKIILLLFLHIFLSMLQLLCKNQEQRQALVSNLEEHAFFSQISWEDLEAGNIHPPQDFVPVSI